MPNPDRNTCSALELEGNCTPDPVKGAGAAHTATITNTGTDRYHVDVTVLLLGGTVPGASLILDDNGSKVAVVSWFAGVLGPAKRASRAITVDRVSAGTANAHSIRTVINYASDAESDPLDDQPTRPYTCHCTVDVAVT
jgi:hypothetical protein